MRAQMYLNISNRIGRLRKQELVDHSESLNKIVIVFFAHNESFGT